ncbi:hypothetical protein A2W67_03160 [Candidatus Nomurabacteria bacterium RIFCSPLOWO2_02_40_28]|uniref:Uncharacterized protein n=2 Tax=Candidatus Nomuraibacteriota TaxID=1752729 RepID=A0A837HSB7_9BACT|nr:MAG: hypothetical protein UT27_C0002G0031 [Candidatus Nomurabacteria bacterium GW2011_GWD2_39_12]KKR20987.1 MAG: hypothetical protein UT51_C0001G0125 [Candidatus Nomurabacteria bacterium GW2011_GWC2_39_41]KKR36989.1 MAG: hypothetical protein UT70_C0004G0032 [Candidatus Nomurabacteria bacterium GW2011_GWE2_40_10]KKR38936.1 MAG: hypothetical protein UT73_C0001G0124 [Candidatus Nomurabacteria bacterium GW2011_GWB1_40_11]KKR40178.1 MAG: hypothetical protein UT74_C0002G0073 [Parcubacteria group b
MKYIFDFDDVLFNNTKQFKEHIYKCLEKAGISRTVAETYYTEVREKEFSLKNFISTLLKRGKIDKKMEDIYEEIMSECPNFINNELLDEIERLGKNNCYLVTYGGKEFQQDKLDRSGVSIYFSQTYVVTESKNEIISMICASHKDEQVVFFDDKPKFLNDVSLKDCPNLVPIQYKEDLDFRELVREKTLHNLEMARRR